MQEKEEASVFKEALELYRKKEYEKAMEKLDSPVFSKVRFPWQRLLKAVIYRDTGCILTELSELRALEAELTDEETALRAHMWSLTGSALRVLGENKKAQQAFLNSVRIAPDLQQKLAEASNAIFVSNCLPEFAEKSMAGLFEIYNGFLTDITPYREYRHTGGALRLGLISGDFCLHPVCSLLAALFRFHDRERLQLYCYSAGKRKDWATDELRKMADSWRDIQELPAAEAAELIHADAVDILLELSGHTAENSLPVLKYRPAPVQMSGIGYMGSTGLEEVDYFLGDIYLDELPQESFCEKILTMPHTHFCYTPFGPPPAPAVDTPCLEKGYVTFGCFNNAAKLTEEMLAAWLKIMQLVPESRLILKWKLFSSEEGRQYMKDKLVNLGFDFSRIELRPFSATYLEEYREIDIALDTFPYVGGFTTLEALYMGVPVISLFGPRHGTRFGYSILANCGLGSLLADTFEEYIDKAVTLATDKALLQLAHKKTRPAMEASPIMNGREWTEDFTALMYQVQAHL